MAGPSIAASQLAILTPSMHSVMLLKVSQAQHSCHRRLLTGRPLSYCSYADMLN